MVAWNSRAYISWAAHQVADCGRHQQLSQHPYVAGTPPLLFLVEPDVMSPVDQCLQRAPKN
jgi:hypothetical protein